MKRSRFTEEQIIGVLKEHQAGLAAEDLCRKHGISDATFHNWSSKYGGTWPPWWTPRSRASALRGSWIASPCRVGKTCMVVSDNGPKLTSHAILKWQQHRAVEGHYIAPGKPMQTASLNYSTGD